MNYYQILGVNSNASFDEIKAAYKKLVFQYHPDKNKNNKEIEKKCKEITEAYIVLSDKDERSKYDAKLRGTAVLNVNIIPPQPPLPPDKYVFIFGFDEIITLNPTLTAALPNFYSTKLAPEAVRENIRELNLFRDFVIKAIQAGHRIAVVSSCNQHYYGPQIKTGFYLIKHYLQTVFHDRPDITQQIIIQAFKANQIETKMLHINNICKVLKIKPSQCVLLDNNVTTVNEALVSGVISFLIIEHDTPYRWGNFHHSNYASLLHKLTRELASQKLLNNIINMYPINIYEILNNALKFSANMLTEVTTDSGVDFMTYHSILPVNTYMEMLHNLIINNNSPMFDFLINSEHGLDLLSYSPLAIQHLFNSVTDYDYIRKLIIARENYLLKNKNSGKEPNAIPFHLLIQRAINKKQDELVKFLWEKIPSVEEKVNTILHMLDNHFSLPKILNDAMRVLLHEHTGQLAKIIRQGNKIPFSTDGNYNIELLNLYRQHFKSANKEHIQYYLQHEMLYGEPESFAYALNKFSASPDIQAIKDDLLLCLLDDKNHYINSAKQHHYLKVLLEQGAKIKTQLTPLPTTKHPLIFTPEESKLPLPKKITQGDIAAVKLLLQFYPEQPVGKCASYLRFICYAIYYGHIDLALYLIEVADSSRLSNDIIAFAVRVEKTKIKEEDIERLKEALRCKGLQIINKTPTELLLEAIQLRRYSLVEQLINQGAVISEEMLITTIQNANKVITNAEDIITLRKLIAKSDHNIITPKLLFSVFEQSNISNDYNRCDLLICLIKNGELYDIDARNNNDETLLLKAINSQYLEVVKLLLQLGANPVIHNNDALAYARVKLKEQEKLERKKSKWAGKKLNFNSLPLKRIIDSLSESSQYRNGISHWLQADAESFLMCIRANLYIHVREMLNNPAIKELIQSNHLLVYTALELALKVANPLMVALLLDNGANIIFQHALGGILIKNILSLLEEKMDFLKDNCLSWIVEKMLKMALSANLEQLSIVIASNVLNIINKLLGKFENIYLKTNDSPKKEISDNKLIKLIIEHAGIEILYNPLLKFTLTENGMAALNHLQSKYPNQPTNTALQTPASSVISNTFTLSDQVSMQALHSRGMGITTTTSKRTAEDINNNTENDYKRTKIVYGAG
jgi:ankyrin repeat protein